MGCLFKRVAILYVHDIAQAEAPHRRVRARPGASRLEVTLRVSQSTPDIDALTSVHNNRLFESGKVKPVIYDRIWKLEEMPEGLRALEDRSTWGKAIVRVREDSGNVSSKL